MTRTWRWMAAVLVVPMVVLSACGDDDDEEEGAGGAATTTTTAQAAAPEPFCADVVKVQTIEPAEFPEGLSQEEAEAIGEEIGTKFFNEEFLPLWKKIQAEAPASAKPQVDAITTYLEGKGPELFAGPPDPEFQQIENNANEAAATACRAGQNSVTAIDYAFQGASPRLTAGYQHFALINNGKELHEMVLLKKKATTTQSFDEIFAIEDEEAAHQLVDDSSGNFAFPGGSDSIVLDLEAGEYAMVCFVPVGLTPEAAEAAEMSGEEPKGPPHFTRGMKTEFTVA